LSDPAHQFKVKKNAEQLALTGVCIFNPNFSLVYVEGPQKFIRRYKRLMLQRITWTEAARPRGNDAVELEDNEDGDVAENEVIPIPGSSSTGGEEQEGNVSLDDNACFLVWEGLLRDRVFNNFKGKNCPTDALAKELLGERLKGYWDQAKNWKPEEENLY
jgi:U4/U6 small nuclear ribonucleoprotein PRP3